MITMQTVMDNVGPIIEDFDQKKVEIKMDFDYKDPQLIKDWKNIEDNFPMELALITRANLLLSSINKIYGSSIHRFSIMARVASKNIPNNENNEQNYFIRKYKSFIFEMNLLFIEIKVWFVSLFLFLFKIK
jgi:hypothetical protein